MEQMKDSRVKVIAKDYKKALDYSVKQHEIHFCAYHLVCYSEMLETLCLSSPVTNLSIKEASHSDAMRVCLISAVSLTNSIKNLGPKNATCLAELCRELCDFVDSWDRECCNFSTAQLVSIFHIAALVVYKAVQIHFPNEACCCREIVADLSTICFCKELDPPINVTGDVHLDDAIATIRLHLRRFSKQ
jgi:hypothetical protein